MVNKTFPSMNFGVYLGIGILVLCPLALYFYYEYLPKRAQATIDSIPKQYRMLKRSLGRSSAEKMYPRMAEKSQERNKYTTSMSNI